MNRACRSVAAVVGLVMAAGRVGAALPAPDGARAEAALDEGNPRVVASLVVHPDDQAASGAVRAGVLLEMDPGWHVYGPEPGDAGLPTQLDWRVEGGRAGAVAWPETETFRELDGALVTHGWSGRVLLPVTLRFPDGAPSRPRVTVEVELLACETRCIPGSFSLARMLDGTGGPHAADAAALRALFGPAAGAPAAAARAIEPPPALAVALALAFAGGLLLNLMPCVLPVLGIKVVAVAEMAHASRRAVLLQGLAFTGGVLGSMLALAVAVLALRSVGYVVGWGFQFQEPLFLVGVSAFLVLFALNLLGAFEFSVDTGRLAMLGNAASGGRRSFLDGLLAVALATPCSAPFLGTAVGLAFASPATHVLAIFLAVGLGLSTPFLAVTAVPGWGRLVPRPGSWMLHLRSGLGFLLLATVVWLVWILGRLAGPDAVATLLGFLLALGFVVWAGGRLQHAGRTGVAGVLLPALLVVGLAANSVSVRVAESESSAPTSHEPWSPRAVVAHLAEGRPVFVYFTADWCLTCKLNERRVLANPRFHEALERHAIAVLRADWTRRDATIRAELARFGRAGVPLYVLHRPDASAPTLFPEILHLARVVEEFERAGNAGRREPGHTPFAQLTDAASPEGGHAELRRSR